MPAAYDTHHHHLQEESSRETGNGILEAWLWYVVVSGLLIESWSSCWDGVELTETTLCMLSTRSASQLSLKKSFQRKTTQAYPWTGKTLLPIFKDKTKKKDKKRKWWRIRKSNPGPCAC
jgi:hypothetical protein